MGASKEATKWFCCLVKGRAYHLEGRSFRGIDNGVYGLIAWKDEILAYNADTYLRNSVIFYSYQQKGKVLSLLHQGVQSLSD